MKVALDRNLESATRPRRIVDAWPADVMEERAWRERHYTDADTPLSPESRARFPGLRWFPVDARFRVRGAKLARHAARRPGNLAATGVDAVVLEEVGVFTFRLLDQDCALTAYQPEPGQTDEDYLLMPFRDGTTGHETYGAGRYLDLELRDDDTYDLDFNRAYHPYCAFDDAWACIVPPPQNRIAVRVEAGERLG